MPNTNVNTVFTATNGVTPVMNAIGASVSNVTAGLNKLDKLGSLIGVGLGLGSIASIGLLATSSVNKAVSAYQGYAEQEMKLTTIMRQRMGANADMVASVNKVVAAQSKLGVIGGTSQKAGAQQLATFLSSTDALNTLIPAMNNLAVQQNGYNVTAESMVGIGNMMGKVMGGQVEALRRVGITMSDNEAALLKSLPEQERAALLAKIITQNVGNMNEVFGQTPEGQKKQALAALGGAYKDLGSKISGTKSLLEAQFANMQATTIRAMTDYIAVGFYVVANAIGGAIEGLAWFADTVITVVDNLAPFLATLAIAYATYEALTFIVAAYNVVCGTTAATTAVLSAIESIAIGIMIVKDAIIGSLTKLMIAYRTGTLFATAAQWALNAAMAANPVGIVVAIIGVLIAVIVILWARTVGIRQVFADSWAVMVTIVQDSVNLMIKCINLFIKAMNAAATLGSKLFKWDIKPVAEIAEVNFSGTRDRIYKGIMDGTVMKDIMDKMTPKIPQPAGVPTVPGTDPAVGDIAANTGKTADNTGRIADKIDMTDAEIKDLRDMAMRDALVSWQENHTSITIQNENKVASDVDIDGMNSSLVKTLQQAYFMGREGAPA